MGGELITLYVPCVFWVGGRWKKPKKNPKKNPQKKTQKAPKKADHPSCILRVLGVWQVERSAVVVIDMQRDFILAGGFGSTLGNKVELLQAIVPNVAKLLVGTSASSAPASC